MRKKTLCVLFIALLLDLAIILLVLFGPFTTKHLNRYKINNDKYEKIIESRTEDAGLVPDIYFDGQKLVSAGKEGVLFYSLNEKGTKKKGSGEAALNKKGMNPGVKVNNKGYKIAVLSEISAESIRNNDSVKLLLYNDTTYKNFELVTTLVPVINIDFVGSLDDGKADMSLYLYDNRAGVKNRVTTSGGTIRYRGASTLFYPKKSLKLTLKKDENGEQKKNNVSLLGMRTDEDWILYAAYNDPDKVRDVFSERLWYEGCANDNSWGVTAGMEYKYVELVANGEYMGLYALGFPVDEKQLGLSGDYAKEALYKKKSWESERSLEMNVWGAQPGYECKTDNEAIANGYSGEFGIWTDKTGENTYFDTGEWQLLYKYYYYLAQNVHDNDSLYKVLDIDNAMDIFIYFNLIQGVDNTWDDLIKNEYIAIKEQDDSLKALFVPWDMDITWGNKWVADGDINFTVPYYYTPKDNFVPQSGYLEQIFLNGDDQIWQKISDKYFSLRAGAWSDDNVEKILNEYEQDIFDSGAYLRDKDRWPYGTYGDGEAGLSKFKEYVSKRFEATDSFYKRFATFGSERTLVRRALEGNNFETSWYLIEINDKDIIFDDDFIDLMTFIDADMREITEDVKYIVGNRADGYQYFDSQPNTKYEFTTAVGNLFLRNDDGDEYFYSDSYSLYLENIKGYPVRLSQKEPLVVAFFHNRRIDVLNLLGDYEPTVFPDSFIDEKLKSLAIEFLNEK